MNIRLRPELEELIRQHVERGPYQSINEFVEQAVSLLHEQEAWLTEHRSEIAARIEEGYAAAQRDELVAAETVRSTLETKKREWRSNKRRA